MVAWWWWWWGLQLLKPGRAVPNNNCPLMSGKSVVKFCLFEGVLCLWEFTGHIQMVTVLLLCQKHSEFFLIHCENMAGFLELKSQWKYRFSSTTGFQEFLTFKLVHTKSATIVKVTEISLLVCGSRGSGSGKLSWLYFSIFACVSKWWVAICHVTLTLWMNDPKYH